MPVVNGAKYACVSCVRGHRVSACYHNDRELKLIPPKGRPVKQCDHCRTARKSKSHHGKCDCGSKKDKKDQDVSTETKADCCCHEGESCRCSTKTDAIGARLERSLKRPTLPVKSKPSFTKSHSDDKLLQTMAGSHKAIHRMNNAAHTSGQPYHIPRPHSHHGQADAGAEEEDKEQMEAADQVDMAFADTFRHSSLTIPEADDGEAPEEIISYDFDKHFASASQQSPSVALPTSEAQQSVSEGQGFDWDWSQQSQQPATAVAINNLLDLTVDISPTVSQDAVYPFSPADLPLISPQVSNFNQTISHASDFTNETAWTAENYMVDGQIAVQDNWPSLDNALMDDNFQQADYGKMPAYSGAAQQSFAPLAATPLAISGSPDKTNATNNSMVIPVDPDSPGDKVVEDWWQSGDFTSQQSALIDPNAQISIQQSPQSRTQSMDATNYDGNYDWLY